MTTFDRTVVQGVSADLLLYKVIAVSDIPSIQAPGCICLAEAGANQWKVGLRENLADAIERESKIGGSVSKHTHLVLEIRFSSLGVAHYTTLCKGADYGFQTTLQKMSYRGDTDFKVWHFHADLPLQAYDEQGNLLVTSRLMEII